MRGYICRWLTWEYIRAVVGDEWLGTVVVIYSFIGFILETIVIVSEFMNFDFSDSKVCLF